MYKLSVSIYLNYVLFDSCQKSYEFKVRSIFGLAKKISKSPNVELFSLNHSKVNSLIGIRHFLYNFPKIYSKTRVHVLESAAKSSKLSRASKCFACLGWLSLGRPYLVRSLAEDASLVRIGQFYLAFFLFHVLCFA